MSFFMNNETSSFFQHFFFHRKNQENINTDENKVALHGVACGFLFEIVMVMIVLVEYQQIEIYGDSFSLILIQL